MRLLTSTCLIIGSIFITGCMSSWTQKEPETELHRRSEAVKELLQSEERPRLIGEAAAIFGTDLREYEGFGIINGLMDTGGNVLPGSRREFILKEMRAEGVDTPNKILGQKSTALARLRVFVGPECIKGESIDLFAEIAEDCEASSLRNGWLMPSRINEMQFLGGAVKKSDLKARAQGALVILPESVTKKPADPRTAVVLGGAKLIESRRFSLRIRDSLRHVTTTAAISRAINDRYSFYEGAERKGVAVAKNDSLIQLEVPSRFRWDIQHYTDSILTIAFTEESNELAERITKCRRLLDEPTTARRASLELESMGKQGISTLEEGLKNTNPETQFYAAYSLAYLNHPPAAAVLANLARTTPEFVPQCLTGLQVLNHYSAKEALEQLLQDDNPELRYGALLALRRRDSHDAFTQGTLIGDSKNPLTHFVSIPSDKPLIAVSLQERPEITIFGENVGVMMSDFFEVNSRLTMRGDPDGKIRITRFQPSNEDLNSIVASDVLSVIEGFRAIGASYNDLVVWLDEASRQGWVAAPIAMNPRPNNKGRALDRDATSKADEKSKSTIDISQKSTSDAEKKSWWSLK